MSFALPIYCMLNHLDLASVLSSLHSFRLASLYLLNIFAVLFNLVIIRPQLYCFLPYDSLHLPAVALWSRCQLNSSPLPRGGGVSSFLSPFFYFPVPMPPLSSLLSSLCHRSFGIRHRVFPALHVRCLACRPFSVHRPRLSLPFPVHWSSRHALG